MVFWHELTWRTTKMLTLIVARSGAMQQALTTVLSSIPEIEIVGTADDGFSALEIVKAHQPALVMVDDNLPNGEVLNLIRYLKKDWPQTKTIALTDGTQQKQALLAAGADTVLLRGIPAEQIIEAINNICPDKTNL
jgi:DNA-binding NarL/FixJ family response regulator